MTWMSFIVGVLAVIGAHRIINHELIFAGWRNWAMQRRLTALTCPSCNPIWIAMAVAVVLLVIPAYAPVVLFPLACYLPTRVAAMFLLRYEHVEVPRPSGPHVTAADLAEDPAKARATIQAAFDALQPKPAACSSCESAAKMVSESTTNASYAKRFVVMTTFGDLTPSYSLVTAVIDQVLMLAEDPTHLVQLWVLSTCNLQGLPALPANVVLKKVVPPVPFIPDAVDANAVTLLADQLAPHLMALGNATIIAHDLIFVADFATFAVAIHARLSAFAGFRWFHVCHSAPAATRPTDHPYRCTLPPGHRLFCLAESHRALLASYYATDLTRVHVVPNARDVRTLLGASLELSRFIRDHRLLQAEIVQIFPLSTPRAEAKGLQDVIRVFAAMAKGATVRLVVANAHANGNEAMISRMRAIAAEAGLAREALIFTSEAFPARAYQGLSQPELHVLFQLSNVFIFPTISEACSMTLMEAALNGCLLVLNQSVPSLFDIIPERFCLSYAWGSVALPVAEANRPDPAMVASIVAPTVLSNLVMRSKRAVLHGNNLDVVGNALLTEIA